MDLLNYIYVYSRSWEKCTLGNAGWKKRNHLSAPLKEFYYINIKLKSIYLLNSIVSICLREKLENIWGNASCKQLSPQLC